MKFTIGDQVRYDYIHHLNSQSNIPVTKIGIFLGYVDHRRSYQGPQLGIVRFKENKGIAKIPLDKLALIKA